VWTTLAALMAGLAIVSHLPAAKADPHTSFFAQGALIPLLDAEQALKAGEQSQAADCFRTVLLRTKRDDHPALYERVRFRLGWAGRKLANNDFKEAWPLLQRYALFSSHFGVTSRAVEGWCLENRLGQSEFCYTLISPPSYETPWLTRYQRAPLWLYRKLPPDFKLSRLPGGLYDATPSQFSQRGRWSWTWSTTGMKTGPGLASIDVQTSHPNTAYYYISIDNFFEWNSVASGPRNSIQISSSAPRLMDRVLCIGNNLPPGTSIMLIHTYQPLD